MAAIEFESATRCSCGAPVIVSEGPGYPGMHWQALCRDCYDPTEGGSSAAFVRGMGATIAEALWAWRDAHDDANDIEWLPNRLFDELAQQLTEERERQRGWWTRCAGSGFPPDRCPPWGELVHGPADAGPTGQAQEVAE